VLKHLLDEEKRLHALDKETKAIFADAAETGEATKVTEAA
jgi:hypothetical protein